MTSTLSNEELDKYKDLYSQLVSSLVELHNSHLSFIKYVGRDTGFATRKHLRAIADIADEMKRQGQKVCKESMENKRKEHFRLKEEKRNRKRPKKHAMAIPK
jgi:hypothetical protein